MKTIREIIRENMDIHIAERDLSSVCLDGLIDAEEDRRILLALADSTEEESSLKEELSVIKRLSESLMILIEAQLDRTRLLFQFSGDPYWDDSDQKETKV